MDKYLSRKLIVTLITNLLALFAAFGGQITPEQSAAIIALVNTVYVIVQGVVDAKQ